MTAPVPTSPTNEEKRAALERALQSRLLSRSAQLRSFLQYTCESEMSGKSAEISEYTIGVEALGRPQGYSPAEDASVRRLAHTLRERLDELYRTELAGSRLRIELPKGSYVPRYVAMAEEPAAVPAQFPVALPPRPGRRGILAPLGLAFAFGLAVSAVAAWALLSKPALDPIFSEAWGPLVRPGANTVLCIGGPLHYTVLARRPGESSQDLVPVPKSQPVWSRFRSVYPSGDAPLDLFLEESKTGVRFGELRAAVVAVRLLTTAGVDFRVIPERDMASPSLHSWNVLVLANPDFSYAANVILSRAVFTVATDAETHLAAIRPTRDFNPPHNVYRTTRHGTEAESISYGLITVTPGETSSVNEPLRSVVISGTDEAATHSAAEFFCSANRLKELRQRFRRDGLTGFPAAYQIVLKCRTMNGDLVSSEYETHVPLTR